MARDQRRRHARLHAPLKPAFAAALVLAGALEAGARDLPVGDWRLVSLNGAAPGPDVTLEVNQDGGFAGSGGCNRYRGGAFHADGVSAGALASTRKLCSDPVNAVERDYFAALEVVTAWQLAMGGLILTDETRTVRLTFEPLR